MLQLNAVNFLFYELKTLQKHQTGIKKILLVPSAATYLVNNTYREGCFEAKLCPSIVVSLYSGFRSF